MPKPNVTLAAFFFVAFASIGFADPGTNVLDVTDPAEGIRDKTPNVHALIDARIVVAPGRVIEKGTVVIRGGVIVACGADVAVPDDARTWSFAGKTIYPGLIDAYGEAKLDAGSLKNGAPYWNPYITPQLDVARHFKADVDQNAKLRGQGVSARLVAPTVGIVKGTSALVSTCDEKNEEAILRPGVAQHLRLTVSRGNRKQYPSSPMGAVALARQVMYDARWHRDVWRAYDADSTLPRPNRNDALDALEQLSDGQGLMIVDAQNELYFLRADRFAREFGLNIAIRGSGNEYRRLDAIRETGRTVIVPLNFPRPPNVGSAEAGLTVSLEEMLHWDFAPENPARLEKAGVPFCLTSHGLKDTSSFLKAIRRAVGRGLSRDAALRALTTTPAHLFGVADRMGTVESGRLANLAITDGDLFEDGTKVIETWVLGRRHEIVEQPLFDLRGKWQLMLTDPTGKAKSLTIELSGKADELSGVIRSAKPKNGDATETKLTRVGLGDARFRAIFDGKPFGHEGMVRISAVVVGGNRDRGWLGHIVWPDGTRVSLKAVPVAEAGPETGAEPREDANDDAKNVKEIEEAKPAKSRPASFPIHFPLGSYGVDGTPPQPEFVAIENATVWTCGDEGTLENATVLINNGKIMAVGMNVDIPAGAVVINGDGKHVTPGIIDCHSHMATDGGINEATQAVTAEVRIGDFIDCDDIEIYRQLAGGVTCSNILHGSANPIGGQNQVIKLRWGSLPDEMRFADAPEGIKFALGENVKQSNWGDDFTTRYPQTRMGVEQIMRDEFQAAGEYQRRWQSWNKTHQGLPPRRDLELDAVAEILNGERWIHCHSYRQDEILALIRTLDDFGVTIGTFQHILEGYKVADAMAEHGAMGSAFSDWWAYKFEVYDAIPYNGALMHNAGIVVSFNSDDRELARHLNHEAAKAMKYGGLPADEALKFVTLNPAKQLRIDNLVGSLEAGKQADFAVWSGSPLSTYSRCEQTWIDGRRYFDIEDDRQRRSRAREMRVKLVQKILTSGEAMLKPGETEVDPASLWPREDTFCHGHGHEH